MAACFVGCTTTRTLPPPRSPEQLQALIAPKRAHITLLFSDPQGASSPASPSLVRVPPSADGDAGVPLAALSNLRGYEVKHRVLGMFEGLALGALVGLVAGAVIGQAALGGDDPPCEDPHLCFGFTAWEKAFIIGTLGAGVGLLIGGHVGSDLGHTERILFDNE